MIESNGAVRIEEYTFTPLGLAGGDDVVVWWVEVVGSGGGLKWWSEWVGGGGLPLYDAGR